MTFEQIKEAVNCCKFPDYKFSVQVDGRGEMYLQGSYVEPDTVTGKPEIQVTRRWFLSPQMTCSEIVQTVFKCAITSMEHKTREWFTYNGRAIFGPHFSVEALWQLCGEVRNYDERD